MMAQWIEVDLLIAVTILSKGMIWRALCMLTVYEHLCLVKYTE